MSIEISNESGVAVDESLIVSVARYTLGALQVSPLAELSVMLVGLDEMAELHQRWLEEPGPTDVMAFPMDDPADGADVLDGTRRPDSPHPSPALLGDVVLCPAFARDQAKSVGHALSDELHLLTVHGVLHLLGYDHGEPAAEREMFALQHELLTGWRQARADALADRAQRQADEQLLGTVGLDDRPAAGTDSSAARPSPEPGS
ncbi:MAG: rRNA maturation RNase YbeY [Pseudonocardiales bacterium]|nr:rRNA maturation RNase YbeY [Pseudonocardiales bacterium]